MYVQGVENVYDLDYNGRGVTYGEVFKRAEYEFSAYNFDYADTEMLFRHFADAEKECQALLAKKLARPAYDQCIKASHCFKSARRARRHLGDRARILYRPRARAGKSVLPRAGSKGKGT